MMKIHKFLSICVLFVQEFEETIGQHAEKGSENAKKHNPVQRGPTTRRDWNVTLVYDTKIQPNGAFLRRSNPLKRRNIMNAKDQKDEAIAPDTYLQSCP